MQAARDALMGVNSGKLFARERPNRRSFRLPVPAIVQIVDWLHAMAPGRAGDGKRLRCAAKKTAMTRAGKQGICATESLEHYLKIQAEQDVCRNANAVFVLSEISESTHFARCDTPRAWRSVVSSVVV